MIDEEPSPGTRSAVAFDLLVLNPTVERIDPTGQVAVAHGYEELTHGDANRVRDQRDGLEARILARLGPLDCPDTEAALYGELVLGSSALQTESDGPSFVHEDIPWSAPQE